jgi:hypothetical protein
VALSEDETSRLSEILATLGECKPKLDPKSRDFVTDMEKRYDEHGSDILVSSKQWRWLENLMERHA